MVEDLILFFTKIASANALVTLLFLYILWKIFLLILSIAHKKLNPQYEEYRLRVLPWPSSILLTKFRPPNNGQYRNGTMCTDLFLFLATSGTDSVVLQVQIYTFFISFQKFSKKFYNFTSKLCPEVAFMRHRRSWRLLIAVLFTFGMPLGVFPIKSINQIPPLWCIA